MTETSYQTHEYDVLIVGAGGAGLRAAIEASKEGARTAVLTKSLLGKAHTVMAEGGAAAALRNVDKRDNWKVHFRDTMRGSKFLANWKMAELHAKEAPDRVRELEKWGAVFDRNPEGWINQRNFGGHAYPRLAHVGDRTGLEMIQTLKDKVQHTDNVDVFMETTVTTLIKDGDRVVGAVAYDRDTGDLHVFKAKATVLACGGIGKAYKVTSNSWEYTGSGHALAYEAGADLIDMEFVQFHPTGMIWPPSVRGILVTEGVRGEGGKLLNSKGERFMFNYIPKLFAKETAESEEEAERWLEGDRSARRPPELLTRDVVARAINAEAEAGRGSPRGGAFLDISWRDEEYIKRKLPSMHHQFKELANVDITKEPMEVGPTMHYMMGGVRVEAETQATTVDGLFAAGETAGGLHGANRLGGNSLTDLLVFGRRAGLHAARHALDEAPEGELPEEAVSEAIDRTLAPLQREDGQIPYAVMEDLQDVMNKHVNMLRKAEPLQKAIDAFEELKERARKVKAPGTRTYNPGWHTALDLEHLIIVAEAVSRAALLRSESRGAHTRLDHEGTDEDYWGTVNLIVRKGEDGQMVVEPEPLPEWPQEVRAIIEAPLDDVRTKGPEVNA